jgi:hypothetical protein
VLLLQPITKTVFYEKVLLGRRCGGNHGWLLVDIKSGTKFSMSLAKGRHLPRLQETLNTTELPRTRRGILYNVLGLYGTFGKEAVEMSHWAEYIECCFFCPPVSGALAVHG